MTAPSRVRASAPGSIGNVGPGLDVLGCALAGPRDEVVAEWVDTPGVIVRDAGHPELPTSADRHTSAIAATAVLAAARSRGVAVRGAGVALAARKALPLSGGQGGSAASAVAGAVAVNALLGDPLDTNALLECCLQAEARVAGRHLDNIAPSLLGGMVLVRSVDPPGILRLPTPPALRIVIAHPAQRLATAQARGVLPASVPRDVVVHQMAQVATMVAACFLGDVALFGAAVDDRIAEPARVSLLPGFVEAKHAALAAGAFGAAISGAGPTAFAVAADDVTATRVADMMRLAYAALGIECAPRVTEVDPLGATVESL